MNKIKLLIGRGSTFQDVSYLVQKCTITGRLGDAPRTFSATLSDSEGHSRADVDCSEGQTVIAYLEGSEFFRGLLMTDERTQKRTLTIKAYDNCIYLCNNKGNFSYKNKTARYIFKDCVKKLGLTLGDADATNYEIGELVKKATTYWDVIEDALSTTYKATGKRFYVYSSKGKIYLKKRTVMSKMLQLDLKSNVQSYSFSRSIYSTRTRLTLKTSDGETKGSTRNSDLEKKIGKFRDIETVDEDITSTEIKQRLKTFERETSIVDRELSITATGDISCVSGACVYVKVSQIDTKRIMYIDEDKHTFQDGHHKMELKLSFDKTSGSGSSKSSSGSSGSSSSSGGSKSSTVKYKVTAKSGLNLRKSANGTVITTMPYGSTVTSDGKDSGDWYHVKYDGTWGYAYESWLKSV